MSSGAEGEPGRRKHRRPKAEERNEATGAVRAEGLQLVGFGRMLD